MSLPFTYIKIVEHPLFKDKICLCTWHLNEITGLPEMKSLVIVENIGNELDRKSPT